MVMMSLGSLSRAQSEDAGKLVTACWPEASTACFVRRDALVSSPRGVELTPSQSVSRCWMLRCLSAADMLGTCGNHQSRQQQRTSAWLRAFPEQLHLGVLLAPASMQCNALDRPNTFQAQGIIYSTNECH
jgi:hypothetical protein